MQTTKIEKKIQKLMATRKDLTDPQLQTMSEVDESEAIRNSIREATVKDVLIELLESLKAGDDLEEAIGVIEENF